MKQEEVISGREKRGKFLRITFSCFTARSKSMHNSRRGAFRRGRGNHAHGGQVAWNAIRGSRKQIQEEELRRCCSTFSVRESDDMNSEHCPLGRFSF